MKADKMFINNNCDYSSKFIDPTIDRGYTLHYPCLEYTKTDKSRWRNKLFN